MKNERFRVGGQILYIPVAYLNENPLRPRLYFNLEALSELSDSIAEIGIVEPLTVRYAADDRYYVISGERRLRAARLLNLEELPCVLVDFDEKKAAFSCLAQNTRRAELNFFETAAFLERLHDTYGYTYWQLSEKTGIPVQEIHMKLRLLAIPPPLRRAVVENGLTERFAQLLLRHNDGAEEKERLDKSVAAGLPPSQAKERSGELLKKKKPGRRVYLRFVKDLTVFVNTIDRAVDAMVESGVPAESTKTETEACIEYRVRIPKTADKGA